MSDVDIDGLFEKKSGGPGNSWYDRLPEGEEKDLIDTVVERTAERGELPSINGLCRELQKRYGDHVTPNTVRKHIKKASGVLA